MRAGRLILLLVALIASVGAVLAQGSYRVSTMVIPETGVTDTEPFQLLIQIDGEKTPQVRAPSLADLKGATVISGPNTNSRFFWSGGRATSSFEIRYQLLAERLGTLTIPALDLVLDGKTYQTQALTVQVRKGRDGSRSVTPGGPVSPSRPETDPIFLEVELGADEVWVGEPVPISVTLFTRRRVGRIEWRSQPTFSNFWVEPIEVNPEAEAYRRQIGNQTYSAYPLERRMLVPPSAGVFTIEPYVAQMQVRAPRNDLLDIFGRTETVVRKTPALELVVRQLPADEPDGFSGAVGRYRLKVSLDRVEAAVNDAVALRATVEGQGSLQSVDAPAFSVPADVKVFDPKITEFSSRLSGNVNSRKTWEWILVPLTPGAVQLEEFRFPFFDPQKERYEIATADSIQLAVERGDRISDPTLARSDIQLQRRDLAYIKLLDGTLSLESPRAHERGVYRLLLFAPLALVPLTIFLGRRQARLQRDHGLSRSRRARTRARKRLRAVRRRIEQAESALFHEELARTLVEYVADRFNLSAAGMTYEAADDLLDSRGVDEELRRRFRSCLETCDFARFVPASAEAERRAEILEEAGHLIEELERAC